MARNSACKGRDDGRLFWKDKDPEAHCTRCGVAGLRYTRATDLCGPCWHALSWDEKRVARAPVSLHEAKVTHARAILSVYPDRAQAAQMLGITLAALDQLVPPTE